MNKLLSISTLILFLGIDLSGQSDKLATDISEIRKNKYQVELGFRSASSVFYNTASATILFKKKYNRGKLIDVSSIKFLRAFVGINFDLKLKKDVYFNSELPQNLSFGLGFEKQFQNRKFVHYYGLDLFLNYFKGMDYYSYYRSFSEEMSVRYMFFQYNESIHTGIIPFFGFKYHITNQFSVGIETGLSLGFLFSEIKDGVLIIRDQYNVSQEVERSIFPARSENSIRANFLGLRLISLGYSFK